MAREWLLAGVTPPMGLQDGEVGEALAAEFAPMPALEGGGHGGRHGDGGDGPAAADADGHGADAETQAPEAPGLR